MTRRLRGDMRLCPQWSAPCAASLESSTASLVSDYVVKALAIRSLLVLTKINLKSSHSLTGITEKCDFIKSLKSFYLLCFDFQSPKSCSVYICKH